MFLMGKSKHASKNIPELEELVIKLRSGDTSTINDIIALHIDRAYIIAYRYISLSKGDVNNLISAGLYALVSSVHRAATALKDNNITPYINLNIHRAIYFEILDLHKNYFGSIHLYAKKRKDPNAVMKKLVQLKNYIPVEYQSELEIQDEIKAISGDLVDQNILNLKLEGFLNIEIAEKLSVNVKTITRRQQEIQKRWEEKNVNSSIR